MYTLAGAQEGAGGEEAMAQAAVEALPRLAIVALQLYERLAGKGVVAAYAGGGKAADDVVALGRKAVEHVDGTLEGIGATGEQAPGIEQRHGHIDE